MRSGLFFENIRVFSTTCESDIFAYITLYALSSFLTLYTYFIFSRLHYISIKIFSNTLLCILYTQTLHLLYIVLFYTYTTHGNSDQIICISTVTVRKNQIRQQYSFSLLLVLIYSVCKYG